MLCHSIATARNGKIRNEAIYRSLHSTFHPIFMNIQASYRTFIEPILDVPLENKIFEMNPRFRTPNPNLDRIFIQIKPVSTLFQQPDLS
jgi:hypothetical protein